MEAEGHKATNPSAVLAALVGKRKKLHEELRVIENQLEDRLFSLSSVTSPAVEEHIAGREDGRTEYGLGRSASGSTPANGQGKPKKVGRLGLKRLRPGNDLDLEEEDDLI